MGPYYYLDLLGGVVFSTSFDQFFRLVPVRILVALSCIMKSFLVINDMSHMTALHAGKFPQ